MAPLVSVVMPVRNGERWLLETIDSVRAQTLTDYEFIAVDDWSADDTPRLLERAAQQDERIRVIRLAPAGLVTALNNGIAASQGRYIARIDADDRACSGRLRRQADFLSAHPETGLLGSWAEIIDERGEVTGRLQPPTSSQALSSMLVRQNPFVHSSIMVRKSVLQRVGVYRPAFAAAEDYDLWLRIAETAKVANLPEHLVQYRRHGRGVTDRLRLRQLFSVRLAQQAAQLRRAGQDDCVSSWDQPPDWRDPEFGRLKRYGQMAALFRFLDLAIDPNATETEQDSLDVSVLTDNDPPLSHAERRMAQVALLDLIRRRGRLRASSRAALVWRFIRLHPSRAAKLGYEALNGHGHDR